MSSPMGDTGPARSFESRLNRVADARAPYVESAPEVSVLPDWKRDVTQRLSPLTALIAGMFAVFAVRLAQYHINGTALVSSDPSLTMAVEAGVVILLSVIVMLLIPFKSAFTKLGYLAGIAIALVGMHNAVHAVPPIFSLLFSQSWTADVIAVTEPNSLYVRGDTIVLALPESKNAEKTMPTVLRMN